MMLHKKCWKPVVGMLTAITLCVGCAGAALADQPEAGADKQPVFQDVSGHWAEDYIRQAKELKLMAGIGNDRFAPDSACERAEVVQTLYAMAGKPAVLTQASYEDLSEDWYQDAVSWAESHRVTAGTGENRFSPSARVTREQLAVFLYAYAGYSRDLTETDEDLSEFPDGDKVSPWAREAMEWAVSNHLISGRAAVDGKVYLAPGEDTTRAELSVMLVNFHALLEELHDAENGTLVVCVVREDGSVDEAACQLTEEALDQVRELLDSTEWAECDFVEQTPVFTLYLDGMRYLFSTADGTLSSGLVYDGYSYIAADGLGACGGRTTENQETVGQVYNLLCESYKGAAK